MVLSIDVINQICLAVFGLTAVWLSQSKSEKSRKWSSVFGLLGQPFWLYSAWSASQWGIFVLCFFYTIAWSKGFYNSWIRR